MQPNTTLSLNAFKSLKPFCQIFIQNSLSIYLKKYLFKNFIGKIFKNESQPSRRKSALNQQTLMINARAFFFAHHDIKQCIWLIHIKYLQRHIMLTAQSDRGQIHHAKFFLKHFIKA